MSRVLESELAAGVERPAVIIEGLESMDISKMRALHRQLLEALQSRRPVEIRAGGIRRIDTAMLHLFCAFVQQAQADGVEVRWKDPSPALLRAAERLALREPLRLPLS